MEPDTYNANSAPRISHSAFLFYWLPPLLWMAAMFGFSTDTFSADNTGSRLEWLLDFLFKGLTESQFETLHFLIRKSAHFTEYALLALLWWRAWHGRSPERWQWRWAWRAFALCATWALLDEWHQTFTAHRTGSIYDSLLDMSGSLTALLVLWLVQRWRA